MGVSYYSCSCCGEARYSEFIGNCTNCGKSLCTNCVTNDDVNSQYAHSYGAVFDGSEEMIKEYNITEEELEKGYIKVGELIDDTAIMPKYCPYCQGVEINEQQFVEFLIEKLGTSREALEKEFLKKQ